MPESAAIFSVEEVGQVYNKTNEFKEKSEHTRPSELLYLKWNVNHNER